MAKGIFAEHRRTARVASAVVNSAKRQVSKMARTAIRSLRPGIKYKAAVDAIDNSAMIQLVGEVKAAEILNV